MKDQNRSL